MDFLGYGLLQNIAAVGSNGGAIVGVFTAIAAAIGAVGAAALAASVGIGAISGPLMIIGALLGGGIALLAGGALSSVFSTEDYNTKVRREAASELASNNAEKANRDARISDQESAINKVEKLGEAWDKASEGFEKDEAARSLRDALLNLSDAFPDLSGNVKDSLTDLANWTVTVDKAREAAKNFKKESDQKTAGDAVRYIKNYGDKLFEADLSESDIFSNNDYLEAFKALERGDLDSYTDTIIDKDGNIKTDVLDQALYPQDNNWGPFNYRGKLVSMALASSYNPAFSRVYNATAKRLFKDNYQDVINQDYRNSDLEEEVLKSMSIQVLQEMYKGITREDNYQDRVRAFAERFAGDLFDETGMSILANDQYDEETIRTAFVNYISSHLNEFYHDGVFDNTTLAKQIDKWFNGSGGYFNTGETFTESFVDENTDQSSFKYNIEDSYYVDRSKFFVDGNGDVREIATGWINNLETQKYKTRKYLYRGNDYEKAKAAIDKYNSEHKEDRKSYSELDGYQGAQAYADSQIANANKDSVYSKFIDLSKRLNDKRVTDFASLFETYDEVGYEEGFMNSLSAIPELQAMYASVKDQEGGFEKFKELVNKYGPSGFKAQDVAKWMKDAALDSSKLATSFQTDEVYSSALKVFKNVYGDAAQAILDAATAGEELSDDVQKQVDKIDFEKDAKEKFGLKKDYSTFTNYASTFLFGTRAEQTALQSSMNESLASLSDYDAAVSRFRNGEFREGDIAKIAAKSSYSENDLWNMWAQGNYADTTLNVERNAAIKDAEELYENMIEEAELTEGGKAKVIAKLPSYMSYDPKTGKVSFKGTENLLSSSAIRTQANQELSDKDLQSLYGKVLTATSDAAVQGIFGKNTDKYKQLMTDSIYEAYVNAGITGDEFTAYINRRATGVSGTFAENYAPLLNQLFGSTDVTNWDLATAKSTYANGTPAQRSAWNTMLNSMTNGSSLLSYLSGETATLDPEVLNSVRAQLAGNLSGLNYSKVYTTGERNALGRRLLNLGQLSKKDWNELRTTNPLKFSEEDWKAIAQDQDLVNYLLMRTSSNNYCSLSDRRIKQP